MQAQWRIWYWLLSKDNKWLIGLGNRSMNVIIKENIKYKLEGLRRRWKYGSKKVK